MLPPGGHDSLSDVVVGELDNNAGGTGTSSMGRVGETMGAVEVGFLDRGLDGQGLIKQGKYLFFMSSSLV